MTAYTLNNGALVIPASAQSAALPGPSHAVITANGNSNGILWVINGGNTLFALDAITLSTLYNSNQAAHGRERGCFRWPISQRQLLPMERYLSEPKTASSCMDYSRFPTYLT